MESARDVIQAALEGQDLGPEGVQPAILYNNNIDLSTASELTSCHVNDSWAPKIKELLAEGFVVFRIQTEFYINGHETKAYLAKTKPN